MSKAPPIPPEQRAAGDKPHITDDKPGRDHSTKDANLKEVGRAGNIDQNTHHQGYQQDR